MTKEQIKQEEVKNEETEISEEEIEEIVAQEQETKEETVENETLEELANTEEEEEERTEEEEVEEKEEKVKVERTTAIEKVHIPRTIKQIVKQKDKLNFDLAIQRNSVWTNEQKSLFIHSLIYGYPFPPAYAQDKGDGVLWMLDGKQRLSTVIDFCEDKFKLDKKTPSVFGQEIKGLKFSQLLEDFQDEILSTNFTIYQMRNITDEERDQIFVRLNKGTPLAKMEQTRAMYSQLTEQIEQSVSNLEFFHDHVSIAKNRFADQELILQTAMILDKEHNLKGIGSPQIQKYVLDLKDKGELLSDDVYNSLLSADDYLSQAVSNFTVEQVKSTLKKVNVPMIVVTALSAIKDSVTPDVFGDFLIKFLITDYKKDTDYGVACQAGSAKKENVLIRLTEMDKAYVKFVNNKLKLKGEERIKSNKKEIEQVV